MGGLHTPGPWAKIDLDQTDFSLSHDGDCDGLFEGVYLTGNVVVGNPEDPSMAILVCDMGQPNVWNDELLDANAAVVATAPDLLAFADQIARLSHSADPDLIDPIDAGDSSDALDGLILKARALAAKARGEA